MDESNALTKQEPQLEIVDTGYGGEKSVARGSDGKFARKVRASLHKSTKATVDFLHSKVKIKDPETGKETILDKTVWEAMQDEIARVLLHGTDEERKALVGMNKTLETFDKLAHGSKARDKVLEDNDPNSGKIKVIIITQPDTTNSRPKQDLKTPLKPSFADEIPVLDAEIVETNK